VGFGLSYPSSIIQTTNGEYIAVGKYINYDGIGGVSIIKLDSNGNLVWHMFYGDMHYKAYSIQQTTDGGYIIAVQMYILIMPGYLSSIALEVLNGRRLTMKAVKTVAISSKKP